MKDLLDLNKNTMSSLEIAKLTGKMHKNVIADIEKVLKEVEIDWLKFQLTSKDSMNRDRKVYNLPRRECDLIVSGYKPKYRLAIIDRWQELEEIAKPMTLLESTRQLLVALEENEALKIENKANQIKLDFHNSHASVVKGFIMQDIKISRLDASNVGKRLSKISRDNDIVISKASHELFGTVNSYHYEAWLMIGIDLYDFEGL